MRIPGRLLRQFDLLEVQFHRGGTAEDRDHDLDGGALLVDFLHVAFEIGEGAVNDPDALGTTLLSQPPAQI